MKENNKSIFILENEIRIKTPCKCALSSPVDDADQLLEFSLSRLSVFTTSICISTFEDGKLKPLLKLLGCTCHPGGEKKWRGSGQTTEIIQTCLRHFVRGDTYQGSQH